MAYTLPIPTFLMVLMFLIHLTAPTLSTNSPNALVYTDILNSTQHYPITTRNSLSSDEKVSPTVLEELTSASEFPLVFDETINGIRDPLPKNDRKSKKGKKMQATYDYQDNEQKTEEKAPEATGVSSIEDNSPEKSQLQPKRILSRYLHGQDTKVPPNGPNHHLFSPHITEYESKVILRVVILSILAMIVGGFLIFFFLSIYLENLELRRQFREYQHLTRRGSLSSRHLQDDIEHGHYHEAPHTQYSSM